MSDGTGGVYGGNRNVANGNYGWNRRGKYGRISDRTYHAEGKS